MYGSVFEGAGYPGCDDFEVWDEKGVDLVADFGGKAEKRKR